MKKILIIVLLLLVSLWGISIYGGLNERYWGPLYPENIATGSVKLYNYVTDWLNQTSNESIDGRSQEIFLLTNIYRESHDLAGLSRNPLLDRMAQDHAESMFNRGNCDHEGFDSRAAMVLTYGFSQVAENVAYGSSSARGFLDQWQSSIVHDANMLSSRATDIGVGVYGKYAVQIFASY